MKPGLEAPGNHRFGQFLRRHREKRHLTLDAVEALSSNLGERISKSNLSRLENSRVSPNLSKLGTLALLYDVPLSEMVERYEIDRRLQRVTADVEGKSPARILDEVRACNKAGNYLEALALSRRCRERIESGVGERTAAALSSDYRKLRLAELQSMLHLGFHESARVDAERTLSTEDLGIEEALLAWHGFIACSIWLDRLQVAAAALAHARVILRSPEAPERFHADFALLEGNLHALSRRHDEALDAYCRALKLFSALPRPEEVCRCRILVGGELIELGKYRSAKKQLERALAAADRSGYGRLKCLALSNLTKASFLTGAHGEAENFALRSNQIARELDYEPVLFRNSWYLRELAVKRGDERVVKSFERTMLLCLSKVPEGMPEARAFRAALQQRRGGGS